MGTDSIPRSGAFRIGVEVVILTAVVWRLWTLSGWGFFQDDIIYMERAAQMPFWQFITQNYNGHAMPAQFAIAYAMAHLAPLNYDPAALSVVLFMTSAVIAWVLCLRELFGERLRLVIPIAILAFSPIFMPVSLWWASAMQIYPMLTFMGLTVLFAARFARRQAWADLFLVNLSLALGLLFWEKSLLTTMPSLFVALLVTQALGRRTWISLRWLVLTQAAVSTVYLICYLLIRAQPDQSNTAILQPRGLGDAVSFFGTGLVDILVPALFGGPWSLLENAQSTFPSTEGLSSLVVLAAVIITLVMGYRLRRRGGVAIAMVVCQAVVSWGLVLTSSRFSVMGAFAAKDGRYSADILAVGLVAALFLVTPLRTETDSGWTSANLPTRRWLAAAAKMVSVLILVSLVMMNGRLWDKIAPTSPGPWLRNFVTDARNAGDRSVYDSLAPSNVIASAFFLDDGRLSHLVVPLDLPLQFNKPADVLLVADDSGRLKEVQVSPDSVAVTPAPVADCGYLVKPGETALIPLTSPMFAWDWGVQLDYFTDTKGTLLVKSANRVTELTVRPGLNSQQFVLVDSVSMFAVSAPASSGAVCITDIKVGQMKPTNRGVEQHAP